MLHVRVSGEVLEWGNISTPLYNWSYGLDMSRDRARADPTRYWEVEVFYPNLPPYLGRDYFRFANWMFGGSGISSLEFLVCGDRHHVIEGSRYRVILRRNDSGRGWHFLAKGGEEYGKVMADYAGLIRACCIPDGDIIDVVDGMAALSLAGQH